MEPKGSILLVYFVADESGSMGRNIDEAIRMVDALQYNEEKGEVCPANWQKGKEALKDTHTGVAEYLAKH